MSVIETKTTRDVFCDIHNVNVTDELCEDCHKAGNHDEGCEYQGFDAWSCGAVDGQPDTWPTKIVPSNTKYKHTVRLEITTDTSSIFKLVRAFADNLGERFETSATFDIEVTENAE